MIPREIWLSHARKLKAVTKACGFLVDPSRTADIELHLTLGVHGPGRVAIVLGP